MVLLRALWLLPFAVLVPAAPAEAAHPCGGPFFSMKPTERAYVGELTTFRYGGAAPIRVLWGDGTKSGPRRIASGRIRHRFRRTGRLTVTVVQQGYECCDAAHTSCSPGAEVERRVRVRVYPQSRAT